MTNGIMGPFHTHSIMNSLNLRLAELLNPSIDFTVFSFKYMTLQFLQQIASFEKFSDKRSCNLFENEEWPLNGMKKIKQHLLLTLFALAIVFQLCKYLVFANTKANTLFLETVTAKNLFDVLNKFMSRLNP